jgi:tRNA pseudouridine13 synthase
VGEGAGAGAGRFESPEDFRVEEVPAYLPSGEGGHTFLWIEKRLRNTDEVARWLAREAGVAARDVGYAGRKDRMAVTLQHFSVPDLDPERALTLSMPGVTVVRAARHPHKLRTGQLAGNRFVLRVHGRDPDVGAQADEAREQLERAGLPNRFGAQRFGRDGDNPERARALLAGARFKGDRREARFLLSALQAAVFNEVLQTRPLPLDRVEVGDLARRTDSGGLFLVEDAEVENARAARLEISATGPLFGTRMETPGPAVAEREAAAMRALGVDPDAIVPPKGVRLRGGRRPLRVPVTGLALEQQEDVLQIRFELPAGSFATVLLEELLGAVPERGGALGSRPGPGVSSPL